MKKPVQVLEITSSRYARHVTLDGFGEAGQTALFDARVLVVGAGGLGSPVLAYLAAAGVGVLGIVDGDVVETSNLQRQIVHRDEGVGTSKVSSAAGFVNGLNPEVEVRTHEVRLDAPSALELLPDYDLVIDGTDNFAARYLLNDACVLLGLPLVWASISEFSGHVSVMMPGAGPCYRCVFPEPPADGLVLNCAEAGVLGVLPGVLGSLQAAEAIKVIAGLGDPLVGRLLMYDAWTASVEVLEIRSDPTCAVCGVEASASRRGLGLDDAPSVMVREVGEDVAAVADIVIDVREPDESAQDPVSGAWERPLSTWDDSLAGLVEHLAGTSGSIVTVCASGVRSKSAAARLLQAGLPSDRVASLRGGLESWRAGHDREPN